MSQIRPVSDLRNSFADISRTDMKPESRSS